jgi:hypothetical protein
MQITHLAKKLRDLIHEKPIDALIILGFMMLTVILTRLYFSMNPDDAVWEQFKIEHDCKLRMTKTGNQRASWTCDDGKTYYRWRQQR